MWVTIPSARPVAEVAKWAAAWHERGYKIALWREGSTAQISVPGLIIMDSYYYPGYARAVNWLVGAVSRYYADAEWFIAAGDDVFPDPNHTADEIALTRFSAAAEGMRVGKISGAVGAFGHIGPQAEERICQRLGLRPAAIASQVISRDRHANYISALALVAAMLEKIALEIRHLQRTEIREVEEPFSEGQKGSSAMPHKRNPVTCEQICGLARVVRGNVQPAFENIALWHERDISHSSVERVILPDTTTLVDYMLARTTWLISGLRVSPDRMRRNLDLTRGLVFSGQLLLDLSAAGMLREEAYRLVQGYAMKAWEEDGDFRSAIEQDPTIPEVLESRNPRPYFLCFQSVTEH